MSIEIMKHYEAALKEAFPSGATGDVFFHWNEARKAIEQAEQAKPVGEVLNERGEVDWISFVPTAGTPLYTAPPPRQPLTDEELNTVMPYCHNEFDLNEFREFARDIEKLHGIKEK